MFIRSLEDDGESTCTLEYAFYVGEILINLHLTYYTYQYFNELASLRKIPFRDYIREIALANIEKREL